MNRLIGGEFSKGIQIHLDLYVLTNKILFEITSIARGWLFSMNKNQVAYNIALGKVI